MRILVVSTHDSRGGAGKAAYRFSKEFIRKENEVCLYVRDKKEGDSFIKESKFPKFLGKLFHALDFFPGYVLSGFNKNVPFTLGLFGESLGPIISEFKPDIINIHWTWKGFVSFQEICRISRKIPIVWTMHDFSPFSDGDFFYTQEINKGLSILKVFNDIKRKLFLKNTNITFVSPSKFLLKEYKKSYVSKDHKGVVINNGIDLGIFNPGYKKFAKKELRLNPEKKYIGFGAVNWTDDSIKGRDLLVKTIRNVLDSLKENNVGLLAFGSQDPFEKIKIDNGIESHFMGFIKGDENMARFLSACDLFLVYSRFENYPFVAMEPQCCGTPVIAFSIGGIPEMINQRYLVRPFDTNAFSRIILKEIKEKDKKVETKFFDIHNKGIEYIKLFKSLL